MGNRNGLSGFWNDTDWGDVFRVGVDIYNNFNGNATTRPTVPGATPGQPSPVQFQINPLLLIGAGVALLLLMKRRKS